MVLLENDSVRTKTTPKITRPVAAVDNKWKIDTVRFNSLTVSSLIASAIGKIVVR